MDPAAYYTKKKGYGPWRSITTGKSGTLGGIPHDTYGMTTRSVRQFVEGVQRKLGQKESEMTKFVTGGPDGDLGSNEVILGEESIVGIVDGSGVIYDPEGLDRKELLALCDSRSMVNNYQGRFSEGGFFIGVDEVNRKLPDGTLVDSGMKFRNNFHLNGMVKADYFVPCGGRPESINLENVDCLFDDQGNLRFPHIVEGANLFITEPARNILQDAGCILFKDASTNKGGVTSSSLEVLAALSFDDESFKEHMAADEDGRFPELYQKYVQEII
jgi:glutamate dehydrogenase